MARSVDALIVGTARMAMPLAVAVTLLLCAQWPLRDVLQAGSTQANDAAQCLFALYVAAAITHAQRRGAHLVAQPGVLPPGLAGWRRWGAPLALLLWSSYLLVACTPTVWRSLLSLERFPESFGPGYFLIKLALWAMGALMALQALLDLSRWRHAKLSSP